jgi:phage baseplate assembly protein W
VSLNPLKGWREASVKTLALQGGDLVVGSSGHATITGASKIRQDLALALGEVYGGDRFHPTWGSSLPLHVGRPIVSDTELLVKSEVARVVQAYIDLQQAQITDDSLNGRRSAYTTADVVARLDDVSTQLNFDSIRVVLSLISRAYDQIRITRTVTTT